MSIIPKPSETLEKVILPKAVDEQLTTLQRINSSPDFVPLLNRGTNDETLGQKAFWEAAQKIALQIISEEYTGLDKKTVQAIIIALNKIDSGQDPKRPSVKLYVYFHLLNDDKESQLTQVLENGYNVNFNSLGLSSELKEDIISSFRNRLSAPIGLTLEADMVNLIRNRLEGTSGSSWLSLEEINSLQA